MWGNAGPSSPNAAEKPRPSGLERKGRSGPSVVLASSTVQTPNNGMKLTVQRRRLPERDHAAGLRETVERFNALRAQAARKTASELVSDPIRSVEPDNRKAPGFRRGDSYSR